MLSRSRTSTRRVVAVLAAAIAVLGVVAGCSGDDALEQSGPTRDYRDARGTVVAIPQTPTKVVTLSEISLDAALALDVTPVGTTSARGQQSTPAYLGQRAADIPIVASSGSPDLQKILKLRPDLILVDDTTGAKNSIGELSKIAPTVQIGKFVDSWQTYLGAVAEVLNRHPQHQQVVDKINAQVAETKKAVAARAGTDAPLTASVVRWAANGPTIIGAHSLSAWALEQVGMTRPKAQAAIDSTNRSGQRVSLENIDLIDADYLFFGALAGQDQARKDLATARDLPGFTGLAAARGNHIYPVDGVPWTSASGPLGLQVILNDIAAAVR
ncbi:iron-siderophore ABC transporter substrate-binding protein [Gordonia sp. ABSL1-1]|uniref:ABC transporter substrate-binding protein n=1 Tax=Gordonia sp. ABSL1-1 TaxID=3053923 RepID=UPI0025733AA0|nr:iron-siderophore ABC transporter substrate-binding protein [Gordonia sp. ABSL1-1]MDL9938976.1 iron-siderophore ABC transporter substrate-binding protein [Gordonia sp. ABSL1-1]